MGDGITRQHDGSEPVLARLIALGLAEVEPGGVSSDLYRDVGYRGGGFYS
jgi:hypothetical protein